jgi:hypothetical protein
MKHKFHAGMIVQLEENSRNFHEEFSRKPHNSTKTPTHLNCTAVEFRKQIFGDEEREVRDFGGRTLS